MPPAFHCPAHTGHVVRAQRDHGPMWQVTVFCSGCAEESEVAITDLEDVEREVCPCGYSVIVLSVASFEPMSAALEAA